MLERRNNVKTNGSKMKRCFCLIMLFLVYSCQCYSQVGAGDGFGTEKKQFKFYKNVTTEIQNPFELRDPFKQKVSLRKANLKNKRFGGFVTGNTFSNIDSIENVSLDRIRIVGVVLGSNRRAIAKIESEGKLSEDSYILKEGMILGENGAKLKAILPGGIMLVEQIRNVYDQDEYLETVIPVSEK